MSEKGILPRSVHKNTGEWNSFMYTNVNWLSIDHLINIQFGMVMREFDFVLHMVFYQQYGKINL